MRFVGGDLRCGWRGVGWWRMLRLYVFLFHSVHSIVFCFFGSKRCANLLQAVTFIEQGHVRVGTEVVTDPAYLVTRNLEDFVTWVDSSKIKRSIMQYRDNLDDFDML